MSGSNTTSDDDWIRLNVGGKIFETTKDTLSRHPESFLARLVNGGLPSKQDQSGAFLIDRNYEHFGSILNYFRSGVVNLDRNEKAMKDLLCEADFYNIEALLDEIRKAMRPVTNRSEIIMISVVYYRNKRDNVHIACSEKHKDYEVLQALRNGIKREILGENGKYSSRRLSMVNQMDFEMILHSYGFVQKSYETEAMGDFEGNLEDFNSNLSEASEMENDFPLEDPQIPNPVTPQEEFFVKSERNGKKFSHEGHLYWHSKKAKNGDIWVCDRRQAEGCPARMHTNKENKVILEMHQHNHETNGARKFVHKVKQSLRDRAKDTVEEPSQIISTVASNLPDYVKAHLPKKHALKHIIRRQREELVRPPPVPDSVDLYVIPDRYRVYSPHPGTEEQFLLSDSGDTIPDIQR
ncbi:BTB/POZ domain-containing protein [Ditylenchus destructor]|uniref:BTB/POZ domain-containing protein n=1 Tax=Ditylenchus destructor TaxID=166010 RepID=A0AAD4QZ25_9BILA|nr:BTB/POZ domain-containing protein [Ditylenchus destructor]